MNTNLKTMIFAFGPLVALVFLLAWLTKFSFSKVGETRAKIAAQKKSETVLTERLNLLTQVGDEILDTSGISLSALPDQNPSLIVISQLKRLSSQFGVSLANIKAGGQVKDKSGLSRVDLIFEAVGSRVGVLDFLQAIDTFAPLSLIERLKMSETAGIARAEVTIKSFWAELPTKLPPIDTPIMDLTADESQILSDITALTQPLFIEVPALTSEGRPDPFVP